VTLFVTSRAVGHLPHRLAVATARRKDQGGRRWLHLCRTQCEDE
jgi:hypothetical protein